MYFEERNDYLLDDDYVSVKQGELRRAMYAHLMLGAGGGVLLTLAVLSVLAWLAGV